MTPASQPAPAPAARIDPQALMAIRNLELRARVIVEGFWSGLHRSPYHGFSVEFTEYRQYSPGDDPRYVDWRVFARSDRFFIKKFQDETNLRCHLVADLSGSMAYGSRGFSKAQYAATLAATLAYFLHLQGDAVGVLTFDEDLRDYLPPRHRPGHLRQVMLALDQPPRSRTTNLGAALERIAQIVRKRGLIILISDFLAPLDRLRPALLALAACGHEITVFQILDPAELDLSLDGPVVLEDLETRQSIFVDPAHARRDYRQRLDAHGAGLAALCRDLGIACHLLQTQRPLDLALFDFLRQRQQRGKVLRRNPHHANPAHR
jgi:uncharacterized protein (DUF58 family)